MKKSESITSIIFQRIIGFVIFIILLIVANFLAGFIPNQIYKEIINFLNLNVILFILLLFLDILNSIFWIFKFPFNLFAPTISSIFAIFNVVLIYNLWKFIDVYINTGIPIPIYTIYTIIAIIVFVWGYVHIFTHLKKKEEGGDELREIKKLSNKKKSNLAWFDVKKQFNVLFYNLEEQLKIILYNIGDALNRSLDKEKKKSKKRRK